MAQQYAPVPGYVDPNIEMIAKMIESLGKSVSSGIMQTMQVQAEEKKYRTSTFETLEKLKNLPPEFRKIIINDPNMSKRVLELMDPHLFGTHSDKREGKAPTQADLQKFAAPTALEEATQAEAVAKQKKAQEEETLAEMKVDIATGVQTPTPLMLLGSMDLKDPIAAALFSLVSPTQLRDIALAEKKQGPIYAQQQTLDMFKWFTDQGMMPGQAIVNSKAVANGQWDKVDPTFRPKAERELAMQLMNAQTNRMNVQNTIANSKATAAIGLAKDAGVTLEAAQQMVSDLRAGKTMSLDTRIFEQLKTLDAMTKRQEIEKNTETILKDKSGVTQIESSLRALIEVAKGEGGGWFGTKGANADTEAQINTFKDELVKRMGALYGIKDPEKDTGFFGTIMNVGRTVLEGLKTGGTWTADNIDDMSKALFPVDQFSQKKAVIVGEGGMPIAGELERLAKPKLTPEQETTIKNIAAGIGNALQDPKTPQDQKDNLKKYYEETVKPIIDNPDRFLELFNGFNGQK